MLTGFAGSVPDAWALRSLTRPRILWGSIHLHLTGRLDTLPVHAMGGTPAVQGRAHPPVLVSFSASRPAGSPSDTDRIDSAAFLCPVLGGRPVMGVRVEGRRRLRVTERALDGHDVAPGGDEAGGVEVPQVVELDAGQFGVAQCLAPPVADGVVVRRAVAVPGEEPTIITGGAVGGDVLGQDGDEGVGEVDDAL